MCQCHQSVARMTVIILSEGGWRGCTWGCVLWGCSNNVQWQRWMVSLLASLPGPDDAKRQNVVGCQSFSRASYWLARPIKRQRRLGGEGVELRQGDSLCSSFYLTNTHWRNTSSAPPGGPCSSLHSRLPLSKLRTCCHADLKVTRSHRASWQRLSPPPQQSN